MDLKTSNHSSYPRIGDAPEQQILRQTIAGFDRGRKSKVDIRTAADSMTELAIREQIDAGLDVVTDGQIRWHDPVSHIAGALRGVKVNGLLRFFDTNFYYRQPVAEASIERSGALLVDALYFARSKSSKPIKAVVTGPYTLARLSFASRTVPELAEAYTRALCEEVRALRDAGAASIQIEEPALLANPSDINLAASCLSEIRSHCKGAELMLAVYFGDATGLYEKLLALPVDGITMDFTYSPGLDDVVSAAGCPMQLGLGLIDARNTKMENVDHMARRLERISRRVGHRAYLTTSCGLEYLPRDRAREKLNLLTTVRGAFLGRTA